MADRATDHEFAGSVAEIVAHLDQDPILVEEVMGNGHTEAIREGLGQKAAESDVPVHVVLTKAPPGLTTDNTAEELLSLLHARSGEDGVWFVSTVDTGHTALAVFGDIDPTIDNDEVILSGAVRAAKADALDAVHDDCGSCFATPALEAGLVLDVLRTGLPENYGKNPLSDQQVEAYATSTWSTPDSRTAPYERAEMPTAGLYAVVATVTALVVAVVAYRLLQSIAGRPNPRLGATPTGKAPQPRTTDPEAELHRWKSRAGSEVHGLAKALEATDDSIDVHRRDVASACLERAETRVRASDLLEIVGAVVLARTGSFALEKDRGQYRCCYVDPRHAAADTEAPLGGGVTVPVCRTCAAALKKGSGLEPLTEKARFGRSQPYYEGSTVWARTGFGALGGAWWHDVPLTPEESR